MPKIITYEEVEKQGHNKALRELEKIIHNSEMDGEEIGKVLDIIDKLKK